MSGPKEADAWLETFLVSLTSIYPCKQWFPPALGKERTKQNRNTFLWNFPLYSHPLPYSSISFTFFEIALQNWLAQFGHYVDYSHIVEKVSNMWIV